LERTSKTIKSNRLEKTTRNHVIVLSFCPETTRAGTRTGAPCASHWDSKDTSSIFAFRAHLPLSSIRFPKSRKGPVQEPLSRVTLGREGDLPTPPALQGPAGAQGCHTPPPWVCGSACTDAQQPLASLAVTWLGTQGNSPRQPKTRGKKQHSLAFHPRLHPPCPVDFLHPSNSFFTLLVLGSSKPRTSALHQTSQASWCRTRPASRHHHGTMTAAEDHHGEEREGDLRKEDPRAPTQMRRSSDLPHRALAPGHAPQYNQENLQGIQTPDPNIT